MPPIAQALQKMRNPDYTNPQAMDSQGLEMPPEVMAVISSLLMPPVGLGVSEALAPDLLPGVAKGSKVGDPHALFAYHDQFGPGMTQRAMYNIFGDPTHEAIQKAGWGSSVTEDTLKKFGIPITGRQL